METAGTETSESICRQRYLPGVEWYFFEYCLQSRIRFSNGIESWTSSSVYFGMSLWVSRQGTTSRILNIDYPEAWAAVSTTYLEQERSKTRRLRVLSRLHVMKGEAWKFLYLSRMMMSVTLRNPVQRLYESSWFRCRNEFQRQNFEGAH